MGKRDVRPAHRRPPAAARLATKAADLLDRAGLGSFDIDVDEIANEARAATGLDDFGSTEYIEPLHVLADSLNDEAALTALGRYLARGHILTELTNRLHLQDHWTRHPEILETDLGEPIVIVGLGRTGTTLLQNLFWQDGTNRSLMRWEAGVPAPPPAEETFQTDPRIAQIERSSRIVDLLAPDAKALHDVRATDPTECASLFANSFGSLELATINWTPSYLDWTFRADFGPHYEYYRKQLQLLGWKVRRDRWVLKSPLHLFWLPELAATLPGVRIVHTHRDPLEVVASFCGLANTLCSIGSDDVPIDEMAQRWAEVWAEGLERSERARPQLTDIADVQYKDLIADPVHTVGSIYEQFDIPFPRRLEDRMRSYLAHRPQHKYGVHKYDLRDFGLDPATERERFADYRERWVRD